MRYDIACHTAVGRRVYRVEPVCEDTYRVRPNPQGFLVGCDVDTIGQAADDQRVWDKLPET